MPIQSIAVTSSGGASSPDLIHRAQAGDATAFEALYHEYSPRVYALCLRLSGGTPAEASELIQDVCIRAWSGLGNSSGESAFAPWLHRLTGSAMLESARSENRRSAGVLFMDEPAKVESAIESQGPDAHI